MKRWQKYLGLGAGVVALPVFLAACGGKSESGSATPPAAVEQIAGTDAYRVTLTADAAKRLEIQTAVAEKNGSYTVIPYSAVFYAPTGETSAYVNTKPLTFERKAIVVDHIEGDRAILSAGPFPGAKVATVGVVELYGAESGIDQ
jgi:hypothetical protein